MSTITTSSGQQVETFEVEDASVSEATTLATDAAALELIEQLGLAGQKSLVNGETITRLPYRAMEAREALVYRALCDATAKVEDYNAEAIPLRVLQVIAHARDTNLFDGGLQVWYPKIHKVDDPVLVGIKREKHISGSYSWNSDVYYLLARWGKNLQPLEQLEALATNLARKTRLAKLTEMSIRVKQALEETQESLDLAYLAKQPSLSGVTD